MDDSVLRVGHTQSTHLHSQRHRDDERFSHTLAYLSDAPRSQGSHRRQGDPRHLGKTSTRDERTRHTLDNGHAREVCAPSDFPHLLCACRVARRRYFLSIIPFFSFLVVRTLIIDVLDDSLLLSKDFAK